MCEYCEPPYKDLVYLEPLEIKSFVDKTGKMWLRYYYENKNITLAGFNTVNYCPMCGRNLRSANDR